jgi:hypothetical protein
VGSGGHGEGDEATRSESATDASPDLTLAAWLLEQFALPVLVVRIELFRPQLRPGAFLEVATKWFFAPIVRSASSNVSKVPTHRYSVAFKHCNNAS